MAEGYLKAKKLNNISVLSAGLCASGEPVSQNSAAVMKEIGIDISAHLSRPVTNELVKWADKIFCMSDTHLQMLTFMGVNRDKLFLLGTGIPDPFGGDISVYRNCRDEIIRETDLLFPTVSVRQSFMDTYDAEKTAELEKICFSSPWSVNALQESCLNGTTFFIAEINGCYAGYIGIDTALDEGYITNVAVCPEYRKKGVGKALLEKAESFGKDKKLAFLSLEVRVSNTGAISLYTKMGYKTEGIRKNFYSYPTEDALILTKRF